MATPEQIAELRRMIDEPTAEVYSDDALSGLIDSGDTFNILASRLWYEKAASFSGLIDVQEGNSNRKLSQLASQARAMGASYAGADAASGGTASGRRPTRTRPIERP